MAHKEGDYRYKEGFKLIQVTITKEAWDRIRALKFQCEEAGEEDVTYSYLIDYAIKKAFDVHEKLKEKVDAEKTEARKEKLNETLSKKKVARKSCKK